EQTWFDQCTDLVALQLDIDRAREHSFVRGEPGKTRLRDRVRRLRRDRPLRRPHAFGLHTEGPFVRRDGFFELERSVVRIAERLLGKLRGWIGAQGRAVVNEEREDRVVVGRGEDLYLSVALEAVIEVRHT